MRKVLLIAYYWPPLGGIGMLRATKLARYLPESGWAPVVLAPDGGVHRIAASAAETAEVAHIPVIRVPFRDRLGWLRRSGRPPGAALAASTGGARAASGMKIRLTQGLRSWASRWLREVVDYPDAEIGWYGAAVAAAVAAVREQGIDLIFSTSSPVTAHLIAAAVARSTGRPWVADLRDLWTQNPYYPHTPVRRWSERRLERRVLGAADMLVTVSRPLAGELGELHPSHRGRVGVVTNGFDPEDFAGLEPRHPSQERFVITYTGSLYGTRRNPEPLLQALHLLASRHGVDPARLELRVLGPDAGSLQDRARTLGLACVVRCLGLVPYHTALQEQVDAHVLLLVEQLTPEARGIFTGKVFEYLGAQRPILALARTDGVIADLLRETQAGKTGTDPEEIASWLWQWYQEWAEFGDVSWAGNPVVVMRYTRQATAGALANYFSQVVSKDVRH